MPQGPRPRASRRRVPGAWAAASAASSAATLEVAAPAAAAAPLERHPRPNSISSGDTGLRTTSPPGTGAAPRGPRRLLLRREPRHLPRGRDSPRSSRRARAMRWRGGRSKSCSRSVDAVASTPRGARSAMISSASCSSRAATLPPQSPRSPPPLASGDRPTARWDRRARCGTGARHPSTSSRAAVRRSGSWAWRRVLGAEWHCPSCALRTVGRPWSRTPTGCRTMPARRRRRISSSVSRKLSTT
mmetsp:Transcript_106141/g.236895  ORF Transcript_106141/g.236895 Transcript_106141/m.236895 type:complete len:244 (-) Transcript_106141:102-833(-)